MLGYFAMGLGIVWCLSVAVFASCRFDLSSVQPLEVGLILAAMMLGPSVSGRVDARWWQ